jgi:hypothetical protein
MQVVWTDAAVQAALISSAGSIVAALIAAIAAAVIGKQYANRQHLQEKIALLLKDINFLLEVEEQYCPEIGRKRVIRDKVREKGFTWSGKFTPGRVAANSHWVQQRAAVPKTIDNQVIRA